MSLSSFRAAVIQSAPVAFDVGGTLVRIAEQAEIAAQRGARLAVWPEAFLGGYPKGSDFGIRLGARSAEGREAFQRYFEAAIEVPGPVIGRLGEIAERHRMEMMIGVVERDGGTLYCTTVLIGSDGILRGKHRKLVPTALERCVWGRGDGSTLMVEDTELGRIGSAICWENYMPLFRASLYAKGVQLYCASTVDDRDVWQSTMRHIAVEGRCFVLSSCQHLRQGDLPSNWSTDFGSEPEDVLIRGGSVIIDPLGEVLAGPIYDEDGVLCAEIDPGALARGRFDLDVSGHYSRGDVFDLTVRESPLGVKFES